MSDSDQDAVVVVDSDGNESRKDLLTQLLIGDGEYASRRRLFPPRPRVHFVDTPSGSAAEALADVGRQGKSGPDDAIVLYDGMDDVLRASTTPAAHISSEYLVLLRCVFSPY